MGNTNALMPLPPGGALAGPDYAGVSRRAPDIEDYIDMLRRYRTWIFGPLYAGIVAAVVVAFLWPNTYVSSAVMRITPPQVPERLVPSNTSVQMHDRLQQMQQDILSRTSLSELIQRPTLDLYKAERQRMPMEDVIEKMRSNVGIHMLDLASAQRDPTRKGATAFRISFKYQDRYKAQTVVRELVTKFTEQNVFVLRSQSSLTTNFLEDQVRQAKADLDRITQELAQFRMANQGRLPEQVQANVNTLNSLQMQLYSSNDLINRAHQDKLALETRLQNLKHQMGLASASIEETTIADRNSRLEQVNRAILDMETGISAMLENYKENHPDVRSVRAKLAVLKRERDRLERQESENAPARVGKRVNPQAAQLTEDLRGEIAMVQTQLQTKALDIEERTKHQTELQRRIAQMQARIEAAPASEQKYVQLVQDVNLAKQRYEDMQKKKGMSDTAMALDERKGGENLEVLDPASLPEEPTEPDRLMIALVGAGGGLALGIFMAGAKEMKDTSLKNLKDVRVYTQLPVLTSVPLLENTLLVRRKRRLYWLAWTTALIVGIVAMAAAIYYYYFGRTT
jgi:polysaccharide chain length determinant protein (PEP-CTERM system associated)